MTDSETAGMPKRERQGLVDTVITGAKFLTPIEHAQIAQMVVYGQSLEDEIQKVVRKEDRYAVIGPLSDHDGGLRIDLARIDDDTLRRVAGFVTSRQQSAG